MLPICSVTLQKAWGLCLYFFTLFFDFDVVAWTLQFMFQTLALLNLCPELTSSPASLEFLADRIPHSLQPKWTSHLSLCFTMYFSLLVNLWLFLIGVIDNMAALQTRICNVNLRSSTHRPLNPKVGGIISWSTPFFVVNYSSGGKKFLSPLTTLITNKLLLAHSTPKRESLTPWTILWEQLGF